MKQPRLTEAEIADALKTVKEWEITDGILRREVNAPSFLQAIDLVAAIARIAEDMNHHPDIDIRWRCVKLALVTHDSGGLTALDFEQARRINELVVSTL